MSKNVIIAIFMVSAICVMAEPDITAPAIPANDIVVAEQTVPETVTEEATGETAKEEPTPSSSQPLPRVLAILIAGGAALVLARRRRNQQK